MRKKVKGSRLGRCIGLNEYLGGCCCCDDFAAVAAAEAGGC